MSTRVPPPVAAGTRSMAIVPAELAHHQVADDREPQAGGALDVEALRQPAAVVAHLDRQLVAAVAAGCTVHVADTG